MQRCAYQPDTCIPAVLIVSSTDHHVLVQKKDQMNSSLIFSKLIWLHLCLTITFLHPIPGFQVPEMELAYSVENNPCSYEAILSLRLVNCSTRSLTYLLPSWFPESTTELMLQSNLLMVLHNDTLTHLHLLERLSLENNLLRYIQATAFQGLHNLNYLNLEYNRLQLFSLPANIFNDLIHLTELRLVQKDISFDEQKKNVTKIFSNKSFPENMFLRLINLTLLTITASGDYLYFNEEFKHLKELHTVVVTGTISTIDQNSFIHVQNVQHLSLVDLEEMARMSDLSLGAFLKMRSLNYDVVDLGLRNSLKTLRPLVNSTVDSIRFKNVRASSKYASLMSKDGVLDDIAMQYLLQICVRELHLIGCDIFVILPSAFNSSTFNSCLRTLSIFNNPVIGSIFGLFSIFHLKSVNRLVLTSTFVTHFADDTDILYSSNMVSAALSMTASIDSLRNHQTMHGNSSILVNNNCNIYISKSLKYMDLSRLFGSLHLSAALNFLGGETLVHLRLIQNGISGIKKPIMGLRKLKTLYLSNNNFESFPLTFFDSYPALELLALDSCHIDGLLMSQHSFRVFQNLPSLQSLDLSFNSLDMLSPQTFSTNPNLTSLNLAGNRFKKVPFDIKLTPSVKFLDIRQNALTTIDISSRKALDEKLNTLGEFRLLLSGNILSCGCENLLLLQWLQETRVELDGNRNFTCMNIKGILSSTLTYSNLDGLWRECWGQFFFNLSMALLCFTLLGYILFFTWIKNKTFILSSILQIFTDFKLKKPSDYQSGVYLGYAESEYKFPCSELRQFIENELCLNTFIRDRDLLPSLDIAQGVMDAINSSWRILLVINERFVHQDDWFLFTIRAAIYSISPANPSRVVVLVEKNKVHSLPTELLSSVPNENIIVVSQMLLTYKLKQALKTRLLSLK
ncbi:toll-like receptor 5 [Biomphalaria pfeifferi]|uniref:Toll-like receptor 5 n=1 Tax=Biomphalaria pfeifferi TaxID=112525 RepID=A0AAD8CAA1_BIOPF|nr:toll-like receptor 5 [Biomphalaria pfeifferi]